MLRRLFLRWGRLRWREVPGRALVLVCLLAAGVGLVPMTRAAGAPGPPGMAASTYQSVREKRPYATGGSQQSGQLSCAACHRRFAGLPRGGT